MNHNGKAKRGVVRFLSCLMAVLVCATLAIEVGAETVPQTTPIEASTVENVQEETIETAPESKKETASEDIKQPSDDVDKAREEIAAMRKRLEKQMTLVYISPGSFFLFPHLFKFFCPYRVLTVTTCSSSCRSCWRWP